MNLVIGATGQSGRAAASALAARQGPVRVLLRPGSDDEPYVRAGCEIMRGDLTRPETLAPALESVTGIVNFVGIGHDLKTPRGTVEKVEIVGNRNLIAAARAAGGAPHVVYLSVVMAERAPYAKPFAAKLATEARLRQSGLPFTILRASNLTESIVGDFVSDGVANLAGAFPHPTSPISVHDLGEIAARCLDELGPSRAIHDVFGPDTMSFPEVISRWSHARGRTSGSARCPSRCFAPWPRWRLRFDRCSRSSPRWSGRSTSSTGAVTRPRAAASSGVTSLAWRLPRDARKAQSERWIPAADRIYMCVETESGGHPMRQVMVRYKVKPDLVAENEELVRAVYDELGRVAPAGFRYATFRLDDGVTFMHLASTETDDGQPPLSDLGAFKRFQENLRERCDEPPAFTDLDAIGSYRM